MSEKKPFYITTTIPYVNADPHIGFALELVQSDAIARYKRLMGHEVFFSTGTDEFGQKIWEAAQKEGRPVQEYVDHFAERFLQLKETLHLSTDNFIRTTSPEHIEAVQAFWQKCVEKGDIYKKPYRGLYCVGCEKFITEKDLVDGHCPHHPNQTPELIEEENYFFRLSRYKEQIVNMLQEKDNVLPEWRRQEALNFVENALEDFSVSRNRERLQWGVPVPGDDAQVMYVWFGAFVNYISTLGWSSPSVGESLPRTRSGGESSALVAGGGGADDLFTKFWVHGETLQTAGKDMVKFQSVMWQGMLMSAGLPTTNKILYHGFITSGGQKMSKSLGNVINPIELVNEYGADAVRYYLLRHVQVFEDSDITLEKFKEVYNANLANGIGNLASRLLNLGEKHLEKAPTIPEKSLPEEWITAMENFRMDHASDIAWKWIGELDQEIAEKQPFKLIKTDPEAAKEMLRGMLVKLYTIGRMLNPLLPETSAKIKALVKANKKPEEPLFLRKE